MERAASFDSSLTFTDSDAATITSICRRLDGIPLAMELAAARVSTLGLSALRNRLADGFVLAGGARNLPARQQTMLATILWSYNLLTDKERMLLDRLSVFSGGFTLAAAEGVCSGDGLTPTEIPDILSSLCDKSLVTVQHSEDVVRYRLLDAVRAFAGQQLEAAQQREALLSRHARWLADFGDWIDTNRVAMTQRKLRLVADPELDNARAAISWSLDSDGSPDSALLAARILGGLRTIWLTSGRREECRRVAERTLAIVGEEKHPEVAARLLRALIQSSAGDEMQAFTKRAIPVFERIGDIIGIALLHSHLAFALNRRGLVAEAEGHIARHGVVRAQRSAAVDALRRDASNPVVGSSQSG
jgi:predicted ATPase